MKSYSALIIILLSAFLYVSPVEVNAQCFQKLKTVIVKESGQPMTGEFNLDVTSTGPFEGRLVQIIETEEKPIESFSGAGSRVFSFDGLNLANDELYRVIVDFKNETSFLCKRRVLDIEFTNRN